MRFRFSVRLALILLGGMVACWLVLATTIDRVFAARNPRIALFWNPDSADANAKFADTLIQADQTASARVAVQDHARRSLRRQPVNPGAARLLGVVAVLEDKPERALRLARYAEAMSRRDLPTQLWLIELNVERGDIPAVLRHYDRALKTSVRGRTALFPILAAAADDRAIWEPLAEVLARRPQWWRPFVVQFVPRSRSPDALYTFARRLGITHPPGLDTDLLQSIEKRLVDLGAYAQAADLYNRAHGMVPSAGAPLRNGGFEKPGGWDPFDWNLIDEPDLAAVRQPSPAGRGGNALLLTASNGRGGDVAVQLVMLAPGAYDVLATVGSVAGDPLAFPRLVVRCVDGRQVLDAPFPPAPESGRGWRAAFVVPPGCPAQRVVLRASSSLEPSAAMPWVDNIAIQPKGAR